MLAKAVEMRSGSPRGLEGLLEFFQQAIEDKVGNVLGNELVCSSFTFLRELTTEKIPLWGLGVLRLVLLVTMNT